VTSFDATDSWPPPPQPGAEGCIACGGLGIVAVTDLGDVSWLEPSTPPEDWERCWECQAGE